jgi:hypothetical protein
MVAITTNNLRVDQTLRLDEIRTPDTHKTHLFNIIITPRHSKNISAFPIELPKSRGLYSHSQSNHARFTLLTTADARA